jgi:hypothetical protein
MFSFTAGPDFTQLMLTMAPALIGAASGSQSTAETVTSLLPLLSPLLSGISIIFKTSRF